MLTVRPVKPSSDDCVNAYWAWMKEFPEESDRTDWLIEQLTATQADAADAAKPVSLHQIQRTVQKVANQFSTLVSPTCLLRLTC